MSDSFAKPQSIDPEAGFTDNPSVSQAANDLRAAAGERAKELATDANDKAQELKSKAVESAQHFRDAATEKATAFRQVAGDRATQFKTVADEQWTHTRDRAKDLHGTAEDYIRENPTKCVLSALGVGFLIGLISRR